MNKTDVPDFPSAIALLFREVFEGRPADKNYTWFVEGKEGLFDAYEHLDAERASRKPSTECNTIIAHLNHVRYALSLNNAYARGEEPDADWEGSWDVQAMTPDAWDHLGRELRREYDETRAYLESNPVLPDQMFVNGMTALVPHMAYHLGAIRQLMKVV